MAFAWHSVHTHVRVHFLFGDGFFPVFGMQNLDGKVVQFLVACCAQGRKIAGAAIKSRLI